MFIPRHLKDTPVCSSSAVCKQESTGMMVSLPALVVATVILLLANDAAAVVGDVASRATTGSGLGRTSPLQQVRLTPALQPYKNTKARMHTYTSKRTHTHAKKNHSMHDFRGHFLKT